VRRALKPAVLREIYREFFLASGLLGIMATARKLSLEQQGVRFVDVGTSNGDADCLNLE
jgi:hypothetical protein